MYLPFNYGQINIFNGSYNPSPVKIKNTKYFDYWVRSLFQRFTAVYELEIPEDWKGPVRDFLYYCLLKFGYVAVFDSPEFGISFQPCNISGVTFYYQPAIATISNPALKESLELKIGTDCELLKLTPDYIGLMDIIFRYAGELATLDNAINIALINSKFAWILGANSKSAADALKKAIDLVNKGEPAVVVDKKLMGQGVKPSEAEPWQHLDFEVKKNYILTDLLTDFQTLLNNFDAEIGIPTMPYQKRERLVSSETQIRQFDGSARASVWLDTFNSSAELVNEMFGTSIRAELRYPVETDESEVTEDGNE